MFWPQVIPALPMGCLEESPVTDTAKSRLHAMTCSAPAQGTLPLPEPHYPEKTLTRHSQTHRTQGWEHCMGPAASVALRLLKSTTPGDSRAQRTTQRVSGWLQNIHYTSEELFPLCTQVKEVFKTKELTLLSHSRLLDLQIPQNTRHSPTQNTTPPQKATARAMVVHTLHSGISQRCFSRSPPTFHETIRLFLSHCHSPLCARTRSCITQIEELHRAETISFKIVLVRLVSPALTEKGQPSAG